MNEVMKDTLLDIVQIQFHEQVDVHLIVDHKDESNKNRIIVFL